MSKVGWEVVVMWKESVLFGVGWKNLREFDCSRDSSFFYIAR